MRFLDRFSRGQFSLARTAAFSDTAFAIIVTFNALTPQFYTTPWRERCAAHVKSKRAR
jgi:hypothetical protein